MKKIISHTNRININAFDIETYEENGVFIPYCVCFSINNIYYSVYYDDNDLIIKSLHLIDKIEVFDTNVVFYVHNLSFDGNFLIDSLTRHNIFFEYLIKDLTIYFIKFKFNNLNIVFRCSFKIIPMSLKKIGDFLKMEKLDFPHNFIKKDNLFFKGFSDVLSREIDVVGESIEYCKRDVKIVVSIIKLMYEVLSIYDLNMINNTYSAPSLSFKIFSKYYNKTNADLYINRKDYSLRKLILYGGRTEIFGNPTEKEYVHHFDFSGMYGQCMEEYFPWGSYEIIYNNLDINSIGWHMVTVRSSLEIPVLPHHYNNKLFFPNGEFSGCYYYEELNLFVEMGGEILEHLWSVVFKTEKRVFAEFINDFNKIKDKGGMFKLFGKLMINSLYGGFGLNNSEYYDYLTTSFIEYESLIKNFDIISHTKINNHYMVKILKNYKSKGRFEKKIDKFRNVFYAAAVSSKARIKLYKGFITTIENNGRLLYCDTDSIFASFTENKINVKMNDIIWTDVYKDAVFIKPKFYGLKNIDSFVIKSKGVRNPTSNFDLLKKKFYSNDEYIEYKNEFRFKKIDFLVYPQIFDKQIKLLSYDKRIFSDDKKTTTAVIIRQ